MPLKIIQGDITRVQADAIVNAANSSLLGGGGVDGAIHRAAGPQLLEACRRIGGCTTGEARITPGFLLPADFVIHTVGPVWAGGRSGELELLASCYRASLAIALEKNLSSIAFPLISAGAYGFPADTAASIAIREIRAFLENHEMLVWLVVYDRGTFRMSDDRFSSILDFIGENLEISENDDGDGGRPDPELRTVILSAPRLDEPQPERRFSLNSPRDFSPERLELELDETFSQRLLRWIDARGMTDAQCYRKANIDRKLFSKIRSNIYYQPSKPTVLAFAAALELNLDQTKDLLLSAGFALSRSLHSDLIFRYYIESGIWDIFEINEALFAFGEKPLP